MVCSLKGDTFSGARSCFSTLGARRTKVIHQGACARRDALPHGSKCCLLNQSNFPVDTPAPHQKAAAKTPPLTPAESIVVLGTAAALGRRLPWVVHWQSDALTPHGGGLIRWCYRLYKPFESALLRHNEIVVTSDRYLDTSATLAPFTNKCVVIPLGIEDRFEARIKTETPIDAGKPLKVIAVGRLAHYKGFDMLLHAISQTHQVELDLIGHGEQLNSLKALCQQLGITNRVRLHGTVNDDERDALLQSDCLCLPSTDRTRSFGIVLLGHSAGKPCVVTDVPGSGMTTVVKAGQTGLVVPCGDHLSWLPHWRNSLTTARCSRSWARKAGNGSCRRSRVSGQPWHS